MSGTEATMFVLVGYLTLLASGHRIGAAEPWSSESVAAEVEPEQGEVVLPGVSALASQMMVRTARGNRQYDVPQIGVLFCYPGSVSSEVPLPATRCCFDGDFAQRMPPTDDEVMDRFACPTPDRMRRYRCIDDHVLCDGFMDCPNGEDEDRQACMFYKTTKAHLDILADALLRWARGR